MPSFELNLVMLAVVLVLYTIIAHVIEFKRVSAPNLN